jgi:hypothetical protein
MKYTSLLTAAALVAAGALASHDASFAPAASAAGGCSACAAAANSPYAPAPATAFAGTRWALPFPAGWLGVNAGKDGKLEASLLWGGGNPEPIAATERDGKLILTREHKQKRRTVIETLTGVRDGEKLTLTQTWTANGQETRKSVTHAAKLIAPVPPRPDLSRLVFGEPVALLSAAGNVLEANWLPMNRRAFNGWTLKDGVLANNVFGPDGKHKHGTNLRTKARNFADFNLRTEVNITPQGNSGIYLRGIYEIQMHDSFAAPLSNLHMGALYGRVTPSVKAEKPAGEWQTVDITLIDRHVTVILNGKKIIDNQPVLGVTGGAISNDEAAPGPIYLQGDHTNVSYRNMVLTPIVGRK